MLATQFRLFFLLLSTFLFWKNLSAQQSPRQTVDSPTIQVTALDFPDFPVDSSARNVDFLSLCCSDSIPDAEVVAFVQTLREKSLQLENSIIQSQLRVQYARQTLQDQYKTYKEAGIGKSDLLDLEKKIKQAQEEEKKIGKTRGKAKNLVSEVVKISEGSISNMRQKLPEIKEKVEAVAELASTSDEWFRQNMDFESTRTVIVPIIADTPPVPSDAPPAAPIATEAEIPSPPSEDQIPSTKKKRKEKKTKIPEVSVPSTPEPATETPDATIPAETTPPVPQPPTSPEPEVSQLRHGLNPSDFAVYSRQKDVLFNPPTPPCQLQHDTTDTFSGKVWKQTTEIELFRHTNPALKPFLGDQAHVVCHASVSRLGDVVILNLTFQVRDRNAQKAFNGIKKGNLLTLKFINGQTAQSPNMREEIAILEEDGAVTAYKAQYPFDKAILKKIQQNELDKIRIQWNTGYEDFEMYHLDAVRNMTRCVE